MKLFIELLARSTGLKKELNESGSAVVEFTKKTKKEFNETNKTPLIKPQKIRQDAHEAEAAVVALTRKTRNEFHATSRTPLFNISSIRQSVGSLQGQLAALGLSVGMLQQLSQSAHLDKGLTQIKQTAGETGDVVKGLRKDFFDMSRETGRDVDKIKTGFDSMIQSGQSWKSSLESTRGINIASAVSGANESVLAKGLTVGAEQFNFDLEKPGQALVLLDKMTVAGRLGSAELENLSDIFARVGANAAEAQFGFDKTLAFIETLSKVEKQPERLATLADSTLRVFTNMRYMAAAQKGTGIKFFADNGKRRDPVEVLKDISKRYKTLKTDQERAVFMERALGKADLDTQKGMRTLLKGNALNNMAKFTTEIGKAGGTLQKDLPEAINNAVDQAGRLKAVMRQAADELAQPINRLFSDWVKFGLDTKANGGMGLTGGQMIGGGAALAGGTYLAARLGNGALKGIAGRLLSKGSSTAIGVAEGKALQAAAGVTPVFVTNWPAGGLPGGGILPGGSPAGTAGKYLAPLALYSLPVAVAAAPFISKMISDKQRENGWGTQTIGRDSREYEVMGIGSRRPAPRNDIKIDLQIDSGGRVFARSNDMSTSANIGGKRGNFFDALTSTEAM